jgi:HD-GYP domain-containing protein (c-di-GMP phosphodiesterase class II)
MLEIVKVNVEDLELGMFVSGLDRSWLESPFAVQGLLIKDEEDLATLRALCKYVFIDVEKGEQREPRRPAPRVAPAHHERRRQPRKGSDPITRDRLDKAKLLPGRELTTYRDQSDWETEYPKATTAVDTLSAEVRGLYGSLARGGALDMLSIKRSVEPMIDSITRNPDACIWLARLRQLDEYTYQHSVATSIWAVAMGRQLGLPKQDLRTLAVGGLLFDVGKLQVPPDLLNSPERLEGEDLEQVRAHVHHGAAFITESGTLNNDIIAMALHHHERHDGSGYPDGLKGDNIPIFARIAGIVDCYDALTSDRSYARGQSPSSAIKYLHDARDREFQAEFVEEFIQAIGIYPAGTLVELTSGEVAVVVSEYRSRRLRPRVLLLLDGDKQPLAKPHMLDLLETTEDASGRPLEILTSLAPGAHGIDPCRLGL